LNRIIICGLIDEVLRIVVSAKNFLHCFSFLFQILLTTQFIGSMVEGFYYTLFLRLWMIGIIVEINVSISRFPVDAEI